MAERNDKPQEVTVAGVVLTVLIIGGVWLLHELTKPKPAPPNPPRQAPPAKPADPPPGQAFVRVTVWDDTERKPLPADAEIWFRGSGSWSLARAAKSGSDGRKLSPRPIGRVSLGDDGLVIYPDGRDGRGIQVPLEMTEEMHPHGADVDIIHIFISDTEVKAMGRPIQAATGKIELTYQR